LTLSDKERFGLIRAGDESVFEGLFREHYGVLCGFARKFVVDSAVAEELVQDLFVQLWERREALQPEVSLRSYLFTAVRNGCLNHLKHLGIREQHQNHSQHLPSAYAADPLEVMEHEELNARIHLAIAALPDRCGEIFKMSRFDGLKYDEIAAQLQLSPRTVEVQIGKALRILRESLSDYLPLFVGLLGYEWFFV
jgi:RNA polymerase sigma-70 factor, ECF subfamily